VQFQAASLANHYLMNQENHPEDYIAFQVKFMSEKVSIAMTA
jgi:hypothetical protein